VRDRRDDVLGSQCFPAIRTGFVERLRQRSLRHADTVDVTDQLAALRGEVYALRAELAQAPRAALSAASEEFGRFERTTRAPDS
jgi:hypothetical protein